MSLADRHKAECSEQTGLATSERRQSLRTTLRQSGSYQFNAPKGDTVLFYEGRVLVRDISTGGLCLELDREPQEHGIVEVYATDPRSSTWVWLIGICWVQPHTQKGKWLAGGRFLFGRCLN